MKSSTTAPFPIRRQADRGGRKLLLGFASLLALTAGASPDQGVAAAADGIAAQRLTCMLGEEPDRVAKGRRAGQKSLPDAADTCVATLVRSARDGRLPDLYRNLLSQLGGDVARTDKLPLAIGEATLNGDGKVPLGNGKDTIVPPPLAFDAGFTVAYLKGDDRAADVDATHLRGIAEACLAVNKDAGTCFSAGYAYGQQTVRARGTAAR